MLQEVPSVFVRLIIEMAWVQFTLDGHDKAERPPARVSRFALGA